MTQCIRRVLGLTFVIAVSLLGTGSATNASFLYGQTLSFEIKDTITNPPSTYGPINFVVNDTVELGVSTSPAVSVNIEVDDNTITFTYPSSSGFNAAGFNGYIFAAVSTSLPAFGSIRIDPATTLVGFNSSDLSLDSKDFYINVAGLAVTPGTVLKLDVSPALSVPEPSSLALCGIAGLTGLGLSWFRRQRSA